jgi:hypothetical protein
VQNGIAVLLRSFAKGKTPHGGNMKRSAFIFILAFSVVFTVCAQNGGGSTPTGGTMKIIIGSRELIATLVKNSSTEALKKLLKAGPITIDMHDYGNMEKVGGLGKSLPTNDERITTAPGDMILYQGNAFVIYYAPNTWTLTRLGKINGVTPEELKRALGKGDVTVTLELIP